MKRSLRLLPVCVLTAIALAACGSSQSAGLPSPPASQEQAGATSGGLATWRAAVACARRHGMPGVPDPVVSAKGRISVPGYTTTADLTPAVLSACATQIRAIQSTGSVHAIESASDIHALVRVAACLRTHGLPRWPDPNGRGEFHVKSADAGTLAQGNLALAACKSLFPPSGWHLIVTPSGR